MRLILLALLITSSTSCTTFSFSRYDCGFIKDDTGRVLYREQPYNIYIDNSIPQEWIPAIESAAATWNGIIGKDMINVTASRIDTSGLPAYDSYITMDKESFLMPYQQAVCSNYWGKDTPLLKSIIYINPNMNYSTDGVPAFNTVDVESLILHELGHSLGLDHIGFSGKNVMSATLNQGQDRRALTEADIKRIICMYGG